MDNGIHKMRECCMNISEIEAPAGLRGYYDVMHGWIYLLIMDLIN